MIDKVNPFTEASETSPCQPPYVYFKGQADVPPQKPWMKGGMIYRGSYEGLRGKTALLMKPDGLFPGLVLAQFDGYYREHPEVGPSYRGVNLCLNWHVFPEADFYREDSDCDH